MEPHLPCSDNRRRELFGTLLTLTAYAISANTIPPLITTIARDFRAALDPFGYLLMIHYVSFALASMAGGALAERFRIANYKLVAFGVVAMAVTLCLGSSLPAFGLFFLWIIPLGAAGGVAETFGSIMIANLERGSSSRLLNLSQVFYALGALTAPQMAAVLLRQEASWRVIFIILAAFILVIGLLFMILHRRANGGPQATAHTAGPAPEPFTGPLRRDPLFLILAVAMLVYVGIELCSVCWIPAYFEKRFALTASAAAWRLGVFWAGFIAGRCLMLVLPARWTLWPALIVGTGGMVLGNGLLSLGGPGALAIPALFVAGLSAGPIWPVLVMLSQHVRRSVKFTSAVIAMGAFGAALGPLWGSTVIERLGFGWLFPTLVASSAALLLAVLGVRFIVARPRVHP